MPQIRILQSIAGTDFSWRAGDVVTVDGPTATAFADGYRAELVRDAGPVETAVAAAPRPARKAKG